MNPTQTRVLRGWTAPLARISVIACLLEGFSGMWAYALPYDQFAQVLTLAHTALGLMMVAPWLIYLVAHMKTWWDQKLNATSLIGFISAALLFLALFTGFWVTLQGLMAVRISSSMSFIHLIAGLAMVPLIACHLTFAVRRRWISRDRLLRNAQLGLLAKSAGTLAIFFAICWLATGVFGTHDVRRPVPEDYEHVDGYGKEAGPFAPSYARTNDGLLIQPQVLARSDSCGTTGCHTQILAEWEPSAHRFAAMNPPFQAVQSRFASDRNPAETRYCAGCHDPISLFAGMKSAESKDLSAPGFKEGISCVTCHSLEQVDRRGNGDYVLVAPTPYLWEMESGWRRNVSEFLIRVFPRKHLADYDRTIAKTPEACGSCHKQFIPEELNRFGMSPGQNQFDEWQQSHWHREEPDTDLNCTDCHMRLVADSKDPARGEITDPSRGADNSHRHHGFIATNSFMPMLLKLPHFEQQVSLTHAWMRGETVIPEIAHRWPEGPVVGLEILTPESADPKTPVSFTVVVSNRKAGHNLTTGPLDFVRTWLHVQAFDAGSGALIGEWGAVDPETRAITDTLGVIHQAGNPRNQGTLVLEGVPLDEHGEPLREHQLWRKAGGSGQRVIYPGHTDRQTYALLAPGEGNISVHVDLNFRRYRQEFLDLVLPGLEEDFGVVQPVVTQNSAEAIIPIRKLGAPL
ncbi:MAG: hypothetical protein KDC35_01680 [Acidobacteria bacterium]|nr:hypothetical protein [Acidobacteriota bacterium]